MLAITLSKSFFSFQTVQTNAQAKGDVLMEHVNVSRVGLGRAVIKVFLKAYRQCEQVDLFRSNSLLKKLSFRVTCEKIHSTRTSSIALFSFVFRWVCLFCVLLSFSLVSW